MREITGYEGRYSITRDGRVFSHLRDIYLTPNTDRYGYKRVTLHGNGLRSQTIHSLVARAYVAGYQTARTVNHIDGDKLNNVAENLEWVPASENGKHAWRTGLHTKSVGERNHSAKLTLVQVANILHMRGSVGPYKLARMYGVWPTTIYDIWSGHTWSREFAA